MIILDTNILSDALAPRPDARVAAWMSRQPPSLLFTTAVTQAEILFGVALLPEGQRRERLEQGVESLFSQLLAGRVLPFDAASAPAYAHIAAKRRASGRPISQADAQIAAVTTSRQAVLATRNLRDFEGCGVKLINPFEAA